MPIPARRLLAPGILLACLGLSAMAPDALADETGLAPPPGPFPPLGTRVMVPELPPEASAQSLKVPEPLPTEAQAQPAPAAPDTAAEPREAPPAAATDGTVPTVVVTPPEPIAPPPATPLRVMLDWYPGPQHAVLLLAHHQERFEHRGLAVRLMPPADPNAPLKLLAAGRLDLALTRQPQLHLQASLGLPVTRIATLIGSPLAGLVLRSDNGLTSAAQLAGKRIGYADEDSRDLLLPGLLKPHGISLGEVQLKDLNFGLAAGLVAGEVDAVIGGIRLQLPHQVNDEGISTRALRVEEYGIPRHEGLILVANRDRLGAKRDALRRFVAALEETTAWIIEHPDEAWQQLAAAEPALDTPANRAAWPALLLRLSDRPAALDRGRYADFEAYLVQAGHLQTPTPLDKLAVDLGAP